MKYGEGIIREQIERRSCREETAKLKWWIIPAMFFKPSKRKDVGDSGNWKKIFNDFACSISDSPMIGLEVDFAWFLCSPVLL